MIRGAVLRTYVMEGTMIEQGAGSHCSLYNVRGGFHIDKLRCAPSIGLFTCTVTH